MYGDSGYGQQGYGGQPGGYGYGGAPDPAGYGYGGGPDPGGYGYGGPPDPGGYGYGYGYGPGYQPGGYPPPPPPQPPRRHNLLTHLLVAVLAAGVAAGGVLAFSNSASTSSGISLPGNSVPGPGSGPGNGGAPSSAAEQTVVNKVEPGMVIINTNLQYNSEEAAGTGMVINADGLVLTNNHVIEGATRITATLVSSGRTYQAKVVGYDKTGDIALIKLTGASGLRTVPIGDASSVHVGSQVVALGNAEGQGNIIPASGQITGVNKTITANDSGGTASAEILHGMFRTDADIVSGDSGGPLSNTAGQVIGMDTAGNSANGSASLPGQGAATGFAIPISTALSIARQIAAGQASSTITIGYPPFIGIFVASGSNSNPRIQAQQQQQQNGLGGFGGLGGVGGSGGGSGQSCASSNADLTAPTSIAPASSGSLVDGTICGSPAAAAGLTGGSVITAVNGQAAGAPSHLTTILSKFHPGDTISLTWVSPSGHQATSTLHLIAGPPQ